MKKYFNLETYGSLYKKITHNYQNELCIYYFLYNDIKKVKPLFNNEHKENSYIIYLIKTDNDIPEIYVGQSTKGIERLYSSHDFIDSRRILAKENNYDNFNPSIYLFVLPESKFFTKNHLDFFEKNLITSIKSTPFKLGNENSGNSIELSDKESEYSKRLLKDMKELLFAFDINIDEDTNKKESGSKNYIIDEEIFTYEGKNFNAKVKKDGKMWIFLKGSKIRKDIKEYDDKTDFISSIKEFFEKDILLKDIYWKSISPIASLSSGNDACNGWVLFKNNDGKTLDEIYREGKFSGLNNMIKSFEDIKNDLIKEKSPLIEISNYLNENIIKNFNNIKHESTKLYYKFFNSKGNKLTYQLNKKYIDVFTNINKEKLLGYCDNDERISDYTHIGHYGTGDIRIRIKSKSDVDFLIDILK